MNTLALLAMTDIGAKAIAAAIAILVAGAAAIGMGIAVSKALEGIARQPESEKKLFKTLMIGLVFLETCIIYALLVVIFVIFVL
jgi:ATP synthase F0, C subunit